MSRFPDHSARSDISMRETANNSSSRNQHHHAINASPSAAASTSNDPAEHDAEDYEEEYDYDDQEVSNTIRSELRRVAKDCDIPISALVRSAKTSASSRPRPPQERYHPNPASSSAAAAGYGSTGSHQRPSNLSDEPTAAASTGGGALATAAAAAAAASGKHRPPSSLSSHPQTPNAGHGSAFPTVGGGNVSSSSASASGGDGGGGAGSGNKKPLPHARVVHVDLSDLMDRDEDEDYDYDDDGTGGDDYSPIDPYADDNGMNNNDGGGPCLTHMSNATMGASSVGTGYDRENTALIDGEGGGAASSNINKKKKQKRGVKFQTGQELETVIFYEVDNSVYLRIEYKRPIFGWLCLAVALVAYSAQLTVEEYFHREGISPYASAMWTSLGQMILVLFLFFAYLAACYTGGAVGVGIFRYSVLTQVAVAGLMYTLVGIARQANTKMTDTARQMGASALHPFLIAIFGLVFRNTVFYEEIAGIVVFIAGFALAMVPKDINIHLWGFGEVVALSGAIYTASMLFTLVKARAASVPAPALALTCTLLAFVCQCVVAPAATSPYGDDLHLSFVGFSVSHEHWVAFLLATLFSTSALMAYIKALQFLPPITVSVAIALSPIVAVFNTRVLKDSSDHPISEIFTVEFAVGATLTAIAAGYVLYISSIKRQRVDMLLRSLSRRRKPKDPYNRPGNAAANSANNSNTIDKNISSNVSNNNNVSGDAGDDHLGGGGGVAVTAADTNADAVHMAAGAQAAGGFSPTDGSGGRLRYDYNDGSGGAGGADADENNNNNNNAFVGGGSGSPPHALQGSSGPQLAAVSTINPTGSSLSGNSLNTSGGNMRTTPGGGAGARQNSNDFRQNSNDFPSTPPIGSSNLPRSALSGSNNNIGGTRDSGSETASSVGSSANNSFGVGSATIEGHLVNRNNSGGRPSPSYGGRRASGNMSAGRRSSGRTSGAAQYDD